MNCFAYKPVLCLVLFYCLVNSLCASINECVTKSDDCQCTPNTQAGQYTCNFTINCNQENIDKINGIIGSANKIIITRLKYTNCSGRNKVSEYSYPVELIRLDLSGNHIEYLEEYVFEELNDLEELSMESNQMTEIMPNSFFGLNKLKYLNLKTNSIELIHKTSNYTFPANLIELHLSRNRIEHLPIYLFANLNKLDRLSLGSNRLLLITEHMLHGLVNLRFLHLEHNMLTEIKPKGFLRLFNLTHLILAGNRLTVITANMFEGLGNLFSLDLQNNSMSFIQSKAFEQLHKLGHLDLSGNNLKSIPSFLFKNNPKLAHILFNNQADGINIGDYAFDGLQTASTIELKSNKPKQLIHFSGQRPFCNQNSLKHLTIKFGFSHVGDYCVFSNFLNIDYLQMNGVNCHTVFCSLLSANVKLNVWLRKRCPASNSYYDIKSFCNQQSITHANLTELATCASDERYICSPTVSNCSSSSSIFDFYIIFFMLVNLFELG
jgi:Leucine-rich repeat (LRR) protein